MTKEELVDAILRIEEGAIVKIKSTSDGAKRFDVAVPGNNAVFTISDVYSKNNGALVFKHAMKHTVEKAAIEYKKANGIVEVLNKARKARNESLATTSPFGFENIVPSKDNAVNSYSLDVDTPLDLAANIYDLAFAMDDYGTLDATDWDAQTEIDSIANDIANGKTEFWINTLEDIIYEEDEHAEEAKRLLNALNRITDGRKYALNIEDDEWALFENNNPVVSDKSILEEGLKALKGKEVNTRAINTIATQLKTEFASTIDKKQFADMLNRAFAL